MTLGGRPLLPAFGALLGAVSILLLLFLPGATTAVSVVPVIALSTLIFIRLRHANYSVMAATVVTLALFGEPQLLPVLARLDGPIWLSMTLFVLAASVTDRVGRSDVRAVIVLGISLALVQAIDPIGVFLVALVIPILSLQPNLRQKGVEAFAFAILVLFVPLATAIMLATLGVMPGSAMPTWPSELASLGLIPLQQAPASSPLALVGAIVMFGSAALAVLVWPALRAPSSAIGVSIGVAIGGAFFAAEVSVVHREIYWLIAALLPVSAILFASMKPVPIRERVALAASATSLLGSWAVWAL